MKNILLSSIVLLIFSFGITLFQVSCVKTAHADSNDDDDCEIKRSAFLYIKRSEVGTELWTIDQDGNNNKKINIALPSGYTLEESSISEITLDGRKIVFVVRNLNAFTTAIFSCNIDGTNVKRLTPDASGTDLYIEGVYKK